MYTHPTALVEAHSIGEGTKVWAYAHILLGATVGRNCNIGDHCFIESGVVVGDNVTIKNGSMLWDGVTVESGVFIGPQVLFTNDRHPRSPRLPQARARYATREWLVPTVVKQGASLGAGAVILAGVSIGEYAMVGAGSVVTKDVPSYALVVGSPAAVTGWVCQCGTPLKFQESSTACRVCGLVFTKHHATVTVVSREEALG